MWPRLLSSSPRAIPRASPRTRSWSTAGPSGHRGAHPYTGLARSSAPEGQETSVSGTRHSANGRRELFAPGDEAVWVEERATGERHDTSVGSHDTPLGRPQKVDEGVKSVGRGRRGVTAVGQVELGGEELGCEDVVLHPVGGGVLAR